VKVFAEMTAPRFTFPLHFLGLLTAGLPVGQLLLTFLAHL